ncbi:putative aminohydrolase SsnA [Pelosinus fermentans]|uniref:Selenium metabolism protein SsnA n=1 Tax=Pelosinus fermentans JBW45 TaxID=1192197 RepID=I9DN80_9FIRM|nr:putative aminohydrolase SsnA [Pelosinus fermentans]AJQ27880.1 selenium metabolism protein SsnA [Pelosinus fermentans JBW45]
MLLVGNGKVITRDTCQPYLADGCVVIQENMIIEVGLTQKMRQQYPDAEFMDAKGRVIMPGMINTHMHLYSTFARGMSSKDAPPQNFVEILERLWWRIDKALTLEDIYYSAMVVLIDCIKNGTTTIFDHHASPGAVRQSLFEMARATQAAGIRSCLCYEVSDRDGKQIMEDGIQENIEFINYATSRQDDLTRGMFGLHASMTLSNETLAKCSKVNDESKIGFHVHVAEDAADQVDSVKKYGKRVVERLAEFGMVGPKSLAIHCVHVDEREMDILRVKGTNVVHNPESNMGNAVGCSPVLALMEKGITVGLGTDGYTSDMFESFKVANILHKHNQGNPSVAWGEIPTMVFENNPAISSQYFSHPIGKLAPGCYADVIIVDYDPPTALHENNVNGHILFGISGRAVVTTIINGKILMLERKLVDLDEVEICSKARELSSKLWSRL